MVREGANIKPLRGFIPLGAFVSCRYSGIARAEGCKDDNVLHPYAESGSEGREEPNGGDLGGILSDHSTHS